MSSVVRMSERNGVRCLIWSSLCLVIYVFCIIDYASLNAWQSYFMYAYLAIACLTGIGAWMILRQSRQDCTVLLCAAMIIMLGPFGALVSFLMLLSCLFFGSSKAELSELLRMLYPEGREIDSERLQQRLMHSKKAGHGGSLMPFRDVMINGTARQKQKAIENMVRSFGPEFSAALRDALVDSNNFVRVQAASAMQWLESAFQNKALELERILEQDSENMEALLKLGELLLDQARSGLIDEESKVGLLLKARNKFEVYLAREPKGHQAIIGLARVLKELELYEDMRMLLKDMDFNSTERVDALLLYAESLFQVRDFPALRELLLNSKGNKVLDLPDCEAFKNSMSLWMERASADLCAAAPGIDG